jgi:cell division protein FtsW (lipid II flippase)
MVSPRETTLGAVRWAKVFGVTIQPSEPAKLVFLAMLGAVMVYT